MNGDVTRYVLDASVFIEAAKRYYAFDIAPGFWRALIQQAQVGTVLSIDRVKTKEIDKGKGELKDWAENDFHEWFVSTADEAIIDAYRQIMEWAINEAQFSEPAKAEFSAEDNADAWLIAFALTKNYIVVTEEKFDPNPNIKGKIKIPNVCRAFGVLDSDTFQMLRAIGVKLN